MNTSNTRFIIHLSLCSKYDSQLHFYAAGPITQIIYDQPKSKNNLEYKESVMISHESEYLRRQYWLSNLMGQSQIYDRISMLANFYTSNHFVTSHYPLMVITGTKYIFGKRIRRLRKMVAFDNSSDGEESSFSISQKFSTLGFLKESQMGSSLTSRNFSEFSNFSDLGKNVSYDSQVHNIYEGRIQIQMIEEQMLDFQNVDNLIIDFQDLDAQKTRHDYEKLKKKFGQKEPRVLYNKPMYSSVFLEEPISSIQRNSQEKKQERAERLAEIKRNLRKNRLVNDCRKTIDNRVTQDKEYEHSNKKYHSREKVNESNETKRKMRQKIREKATQLLNRIKGQNFTPRPDSNKKDDV